MHREKKLSQKLVLVTGRETGAVSEQCELMSDSYYISSGTEPCGHNHIASTARAVWLLWCGAVPVLISSASFSTALVESLACSAQVLVLWGLIHFQVQSRGSLPLHILGGQRGLDASLFNRTEPTQGCVTAEKSWGTGLCSADGSSWWLYAVSLFVWQYQCQARSHKLSWTWDDSVNSPLGASVLPSGACPVISLLSSAFWCIYCTRLRECFQTF